MANGGKRKYLLLKHHRDAIPLHSIFMDKKTMAALGVKNGDALILNGKNELVLWVTESSESVIAVNSKLYNCLSSSGDCVVSVRKTKLKEAMYVEIILPRRIKITSSLLSQLRNSVLFTPVKAGGLIPIDLEDTVLFLRVKDAYPDLAFISYRTKVVLY